MYIMTKYKMTILQNCLQYFNFLGQIKIQNLDNTYKGRIHIEWKEGETRPSYVMGIHIYKQSVE